jgi:type II secretory pathway component PulJ
VSRNDEAGFTIVELLVAATIGLIVVMATFTLVEVAQRQTQQITARTDSSQRGRLAMEQMTQSLRSQVCVKFDEDYALAPLQAGTSTSVTYFSAIQGKVGGSVGTSAFTPERRVLTYANGTFSETRTTGTGDYPTLTFPDTPTSTRTILTDAAPQGAGKPIFTYYALNPNGTVNTTPLATPLSDVDRERVVEIGVAFVAKPTDGTRGMSGVQVPFTDMVGVRLPVRVDVKNLGDGPTCMI